MLERALTADSLLNDVDYQRLNRALFEAIYPREILKFPLSGLPDAGYLRLRLDPRYSVRMANRDVQWLNGVNILGDIELK